MVCQTQTTGLFCRACAEPFRVRTMCIRWYLERRNQSCATEGGPRITQSVFVGGRQVLQTPILTELYTLMLLHICFILWKGDIYKIINYELGEQSTREPRVMDFWDNKIRRMFCEQHKQQGSARCLKCAAWNVSKHCQVGVQLDYVLAECLKRSICELWLWFRLGGLTRFVQTNILLYKIGHSWTLCRVSQRSGNRIFIFLPLRCCTCAQKGSNQWNCLIIYFSSFMLHDLWLRVLNPKPADTLFEKWTFALTLHQSKWLWFLARLNYIGPNPISFRLTA